MVVGEIGYGQGERVEFEFLEAFSVAGLDETEEARQRLACQRYVVEKE